jgi:hypothetical protein
MFYNKEPTTITSQYVTRPPSENVKVKKSGALIPVVISYGYETWSPALREEHRLRVFENKVLRRIFVPNRDEKKKVRENYTLRSFIPYIPRRI